MKYDTALILGAGAFGTSIASVLSHNFKKVICKVRSTDIYESLKSHENSIYLPGIKLRENITPALTFEEVDSLVVGEVQLIISGIPSSGIKSFCQENFESIENYLKKGVPFISLSKGIDPETLDLSDDLFNEFFIKYSDQFGYLSGPSFAKEIVEKQVTVVSVAGRSNQMLKKISDMFQTDYFKVFLSYDIKGVLLGGALKNVLAIAGGIIEGLGFNHNTRAAMITRGIYEMLRFGVVFNARVETFYGLSGMGDLILTTTGGLSRNKNFGFEIAKGRKASEIIANQRAVVEGYKTTKAVYLLAEKYEIQCRIFKGVYDVLYNNTEPEEVIKNLMDGEAKFEV